MDEVRILNPFTKQKVKISAFIVGINIIELVKLNG